MMRITKFKQHIQNGFSKRLFHVVYGYIFGCAHALFRCSIRRHGGNAEKSHH